MNNIHVSTTKSERIPLIPGEITGFKHTGDEYYIIIEGGLYRINKKEPILVPLSPHPLLKTISYDQEGKKVFVTDGTNFFFDKIGKKDCVRILCPSQITACAFSPIKDKLVYLDVNDAIVLCDIYPELGNIVETSRWSLNDPAPAHINVNWGDASTQFSGFDNETRIHRLRKAKGADCLINTPEMIWRPDGKYFLVSYTFEKTRRFKVYCINRGVMSCGELIPGLLTPIAWQPSNNLIAMACCSDNRWKIVIFEPNGHAKLTYSMYDHTAINQLAWSNDGNILAVLENVPLQSNILLLTIHGYRLELKQHLTFKTPVRYIQWLEMTGCIQHLVVVLRDSFIHYYLRLGPSVSALFVDHGSTIGVINEDELTLINTQKTIIAPPVSTAVWENRPGARISFPKCLSQVVFNATRPRVLCVDSQNVVYVFNYLTKQLPFLPDAIEFELPCPTKYPLQVHHIGYYDDFMIIYVNDDDNDKEIVYDIKNRKICKTPWPFNVTGLKLVQTLDGLRKYTFSDTGSLYLDKKIVKNYSNIIIKLECFCYFDKYFALILDNSNRFYCNDILITNNVTSFLTFYEYILFTTTDNTLYSCRYNIFLEALDLNVFLSLFDSRRISDGGVLIAPAPNKLHALLQNPNGVLEVITSQLLGVDYVNTLLDQDLWPEVHSELKLRHLNLNLIVDTDIERFLKGADRFIELSQQQQLIEFILQINDGNILQGMNCKHQFISTAPIPNKVNSVCSAIIDIMRHKDLDKYFGIILLALVRHKGLSESVKFAQLTYATTTTELNKVVEAGLQLLCSYWCPEDILINCLKTYDLDFAMFAYFMHKRDPAATATLFDAFFESRSESELRYKINDYVGDYKQAIKYYLLHILDSLRCDDPRNAYYDELIDYAIVNRELPILYEFISTYQVTVPRLCYELALVMEENNRKQRAAELYFEAGDLEASFTAYTCIFDWVNAIFVLEAMELDEGTFKERLINFADHLSAAGFHDGSQHIHILLGDYRKAIIDATLKHSFSEGLDLVEEHAPDMMGYLQKKLLKYISVLEELFATTQNDLINYTDRIEEIRRQRRKGEKQNVKDVQTKSSTPNENEDEQNVAPEYAESVNSGFSSIASQTSSSSRNSRKERRKFTNMKVGGMYEDIAIMRTVHCKITEMCKLKKDLDDILKTLTRTNDEHICNSVILNYYTMLELFEVVAKRIWIDHLNDAAEINDELLAARTNIIYLEFQYRIRPVVKPVTGDEDQ